METVQRPTKHRQRAPRPASPYSTDSNYSAAAAAAAAANGAPGQRSQYPPRSRRRKQPSAAAEAEVQSNNSGGRNQSPLAARPTAAAPGIAKQVPNGTYFTELRYLNETKRYVNS